MARLILKTDDGTNPVELSAGTTVHIGRDPDNEIALPDARGASRKHCQLSAVQAAGVISWELTDLGATNKTRVNGKPVDKCVLATGDVIKVGDAEITFEDAREEARLKEAGSKGVCFLEWVTGDRKGEKVWLEGARTTLGRRESNTIPLDDRMSSGHHAEITKDLNGYTIRDLGSTNGTLVNGEPTTEASLNHGTRVRIGNSRLVFKDPSMKDIEVELSQFDEDEGWGMMGDIDLSRARGSYLGLLFVVLFLGAAGVGGWYLMSQADEEEARSTAQTALNLVEDGDMEDKEAVGFLWSAVRPDDPVSVRASGGKLTVTHTGGEEQKQPALVAYANELPARTADPLRIQANVRANGEGSLVVVWRNWRDPDVPNEDEEEDEFGDEVPAPVPASPAATGGARVSHTVSLGSGRIDTLAVKPHWASSMLIGLRVGPEGKVVLDDLEVTSGSNESVRAVEIQCPGDSDAWLNASGDLDLVNGMTVLVVGARPVARLADGTVLAEFVADAVPSAAEAGGKEPLRIEGHFVHGEKTVPASITWSQMADEEGLHAEVQCADAAAVGLSTRFVRPHLEQGLSLLVEKARSIAAASGQKVEGIRKTLGGEPRARGGRPRTLVTLAPTGEASTNVLEVQDADDGMLLDLRHLTAGTSAGVDVVTNFEVQSRLALEALTDAERKVRTHPGLGIEMLRETALLYPFVQQVHDKAVSLARRAEVDARKEVVGYEEALKAFKVFRSSDTLKRLDEKGRAIAERYPDRGAANGSLETDVAALDADAAQARADYYGEHAGAELARLERLASLLAEVPGYEPMAAIFYRTIVDRFGHLGGDDSFGRRVKQAREKYEALVADASVAEAVPALPADGE